MRRRLAGALETLRLPLGALLAIGRRLCVRDGRRRRPALLPWHRPLAAASPAGVASLRCTLRTARPARTAFGMTARPPDFDRLRFIRLFLGFAWTRLWLWLGGRGHHAVARQCGSRRQAAAMSGSGTTSGAPSDTGCSAAASGCARREFGFAATTTPMRPAHFQPAFRAAATLARFVSFAGAASAFGVSRFGIFRLSLQPAFPPAFGLPAVSACGPSGSRASAGSRRSLRPTRR